MSIRSVRATLIAAAVLLLFTVVFGAGGSTSLAEPGTGEMPAAAQRDDADRDDGSDGSGQDGSGQDGSGQDGSGQDGSGQDGDGEAELQNKLLLLFDSSGSMQEPDASGTSKMDTAKQAFGSLIPKLPDDTQVGLRVYGATVFSKDDPGACQDTQNLVPVGPLDRKALTDAVAGFRPYGETPISASLRAAARDLGTDGKRTILLVSDGEETCDPDPCETAKEISGLGIDLKIDVVGFRVSGKVQDQLRCITDAGNGTFYNADDADDLVASMERLAVRAFRPFRVDGEQAHGGTEQNPGSVLTAGKYVDTAPRLGSVKYYRLKRGIPGSTLHVGVTSRPAPGEQVNTLRLETLARDGTHCGFGLGTEVSYANTNPVVTAAVSSWSELTLEEPGCTGDEMLLAVEQDGRSGGNKSDNLGGVPMEIVVIEEPPVGDPEAALQTLADDRPDWVDMADPDAEEIVPGASFSDAPHLAPGRYTTSLFPGEVQFVKVGLDWGQRLQAQVRVRAPDEKLEEVIDFPQPVDIRLIAPARGNAQADNADTVARDQDFLDKDEDTLVQAGTLDVFYGNRSAIGREHKNAALSGYYYVAFSLGRDEDGDSYTVPVEITVDVAGAGNGGGPGYVGGGALRGPDVEDVVLSEPGTLRAVDRSGDRRQDEEEAEPQADQATPDPESSDVAAPGEEMSGTRMTLVLVLSGVVVVLIAIAVTREVLRRRREYGR